MLHLYVCITVKAAAVVLRSVIVTPITVRQCPLLYPNFHISPCWISHVIYFICLLRSIFIDRNYGEIFSEFLI